jgi:L-methionine (R)-S-oxide reductase
MAETLILPQNAPRAAVYEALLPQIKALVTGESDIIANLANIAAALKEAFGFFWVGFYIKRENELVLGPFQGPIACTRIRFNRGVCGHCYTCSSASKSEIVLPAFDAQGEVFLVLDVDSDKLDDFSAVDAEYLAQVMRIIEGL